MNTAQYAALPRWRRDWLIRHLWQEGVGRDMHETQLIVHHKMIRLVGDGPRWWRLWLAEPGGEPDVVRVRADKSWDFDALIRGG